jgi:urea-proton symporter
MNILSETQGYLIIFLFGAVTLLLTMIFSHNKIWTKTQVGFLKAGTRVPWHLGSLSIAASWIWAPALFVSVQKAYELGLPGIFWFTFPNILALLIFIWIGPKIRQKIPGGYTLPDWIRYRFDDKRIHKIYLYIYFWYQVMAVTVQVFVGGLLLSYLTGISLNLVMLLLSVVVLSYALISGLRASIVTDCMQMLLILGAVFIIIPWVYHVAGGWDSVAKGLGGLANNKNIADLKILYSFGIVTSIGLIAGSISDQQYWQRSFAIKKKDLPLAFIIGGILFGIVPILLSILGFLAANPEIGVTMPLGVDLPMIGVAVVAKLLPSWAMILFVIMLLSGLASTFDSGLCAGASLWAIDSAKLTDEEKNVLYKERIGEKFNESELSIKCELDKKTPVRSRKAMIGLTILGLIVAIMIEYIPGFGLDKLWWVFNAIASMAVIPTILSLYWNRQSAKGVLLGFAGSFVGIITFIIGNAVDNNNLIVVSAVFIVLISLVMNLCFPSKNEFKINSNSRII